MHTAYEEFIDSLQKQINLPRFAVLSHDPYFEKTFLTLELQIRGREDIATIIEALQNENNVNIIEKIAKKLRE